MGYVENGRAAGAIIGVAIKFLVRFHRIVFPLAGIVVTALEVYKFTRNSDVPRQKEVEEIVYWREPKKSGIVIGFLFFALHIVCKYPIITVITYTLLLFFGAAVSYRVFEKNGENPRRTNKDHPFSEIIVKYSLPPQKTTPPSFDSFVENTICIYNSLLRLVLLENILESVKFSLIILSLTYFVHWIVVFPFTMLIACFVASTIPKIYKSNQETIDRHLASCFGYIEYLVYM